MSKKLLWYVILGLFCCSTLAYVATSGPSVTSPNYSKIANQISSLEPIVAAGKATPEQVAQLAELRAMMSTLTPGSSTAMSPTETSGVPGQKTLAGTPIGTAKSPVDAAVIEAKKALTETPTQLGMTKAELELEEAFQNYLNTGEIDPAFKAALYSRIEAEANRGPSSPLDDTGSDAYGYSYVDNLGGGTATYYWTELCGDGGSTNLSLTDDLELNITLGFNFPFYGTASNLVTVGNNGGIVLGSAAVANISYNYTALSTTNTYGMISMFQSDLGTGAAANGCDAVATDDEVRYRNYGADSTVIEFKKQNHFSASTDLWSFQIVLYPSGAFRMMYNGTDWFNSGTYNSSTTVAIDGPMALGGIFYLTNGAPANHMMVPPLATPYGGRAVYWAPPAAFGKCCYGDPFAPSCQVLSLPDCIALTDDLSWTSGGDCSAPCAPYGRCCYGDLYLPTCALEPQAACLARLNATWTSNTDCTTPCVGLPCAVTPPWTAGFEAPTVPPALPSCWLQQNVDGESATWGTMAYTPAHSGLNVAKVNWSSSLPADDWLFTPPLTLTGGQPYSFEYWYRQYLASTSYTEWLEVKIGTAQNAAAMTTTIDPAFSFVNQATWLSRAGSFTPAVTADYYIGIHYLTSINQGGVLIDDVSIAAGEFEGRCCYLDGGVAACDVLTQAACEALFGQWTNGIDCTTPCPTGRCCYGDPVTPTCADGETELECLARPGVWLAGGTCALNPCPSLAGEICEYPVHDILPAEMPYTDSGTTVGRINDYLYNGNSAPDVVYSYTPAADEEVTFSLCGSSYDTYLYIYEDVCTGTPIAFNDDACGVQSELLCVPLTGGTTYYVIVDGYSSNSGAYTLNLSVCVPCLPEDIPVNDVCGAVVPVLLDDTVPVVLTGNNYCAQMNDCPDAASADVWESFTTTECYDISIAYCGSEYTLANGYIAIFGDCGCLTSFLGTDWENTSCGDGNYTINYYTVPPGTWYIAIMDDMGPNYTVTLTATACPLGRCCYGPDPLVPLCADGINASDCAALENGIFVAGLTCADPCPLCPNDICGAMPSPLLVDGVPDTRTGDNSCAQLNDCDGFPAVVWESFEIPAGCYTLTIDFCGSNWVTSPNAYINVMGDCACTVFTTASSWSQTCGGTDTNWKLTWNSGILPAGVYYYPIYPDMGPAYTVTFTIVACPLGRCCYNGGADCAVNYQTDCTALNGYWTVGEDCTEPCPPAPPCPISFSNCTDEYISNVTIGTINNTTGFDCPAGNYYGLQTQVVPGGVYQLDVSVVTVGAAWTEYVSVLVDWNLNNTWDIGTELVNIGSFAVPVGAPYVFTTMLNVPGDAALGTPYMRVIAKEGGYTTTGCDVGSYGEAEDYGLIVGSAECDPIEDLTLIRDVTNSEFDLFWTVGQETTHKLYYTTNPNNDGDPDAGADPDFSVIDLGTLTVGPASYSIPIDLATPPYMNFVIAAEDCGPVIPVGRCCYGSPVAPSCAVETNIACTARTDEISWTYGLDCTTPCPIPGLGETVTNPIVIGALPYLIDGTTVGFVNDYDEACAYTGSLSPDVVYSYTPAATANVIVSLCSPGTTTDYDTKIYIYQNTVTPGTPFACCDDFCSGPIYPSAYLSSLPDTDNPLITFTAGNTYYIVVDGYGSGSGNYTLSVTVAP